MTETTSGLPTTTERYGRLARGFGTHQAIAALVKPGAKVLDVGCADGTLGALLKAARNAVVVGVEPDEEAARFARKTLQTVVTGDITATDVRDEVMAAGPFDQIILGDVLEHLVDPKAALQGVLPLLATDGSVIVSVPNVLTASARLRLLVGIWRYEDVGIFDRTHLRFFSVATARELVNEAGLRIVEELDVGPLTHRLGQRAVAVTKLRPGILATQVVIRAEPH